MTALLLWCPPPSVFSGSLPLNLGIPVNHPSKWLSCFSEISLRLLTTHTRVPVKTYLGKRSVIAYIQRYSGFAVDLCSRLLVVGVADLSAALISREASGVAGLLKEASFVATFRPPRSSSANRLCSLSRERGSRQPLFWGAPVGPVPWPARQAPCKQHPPPAPYRQPAGHWLISHPMA